MLLNRKIHALLWMPIAVLIGCIISISILIWKADVNRRIETRFLGMYRLGKLDGKECYDCQVILHPENAYDIVVNGKKAGEGNWDLGNATDLPDYFLKIENGPRGVIWEYERKIDYIDRR